MAPLAVAHRGDPYVRRENTLGSLRSAMAAGADAVEIDVRITSDGTPVLLHDTSLKRLWGHDVPLATLSYAEVLQLTGGGVPTLQDALKTLAERPEIRAFIDLADPSAAHGAVTQVHEAGAADRAYYCGRTAAMLAVRAEDPDAEVAMACKSVVRHSSALLDELRPRWLNYRFGLLTPAMVAAAHEAGYLVSAWTVDWRRNMRALRAMGVDSITSNRISCLRRVLGR